MSRRGVADRGFLSLLAAQFLLALNDNVYRLVVSLIVVDTLAKESGSSWALSLALALFTAPFILFSAYAGYLADRFSKTRMLQFAKFLEIVVMSAGFYFLINFNIWGLFVVLFFMALQSTIFSPSKYGILPELLEEHQLSKGNGFLELCTYMGIIIGTALAGILKSIPSDAYTWVGTALVAIATVGFTASLFIAKTEPQREAPVFELNPFKDVYRSVRFMAGINGLVMVLIGTTFFWLMGAMFQLNILLFAKQLMGLNDRWTSMFLVVFGLGIGSGSALAGILSKGRIRLEFSKWGACGMVLGLMLLSFSSSHVAYAFGSLIVLSMSAGFFIVPLNAFLQRECPEDNRGRCIAAMNVVNYLGMLAAGALLYFCTDLLGVNAAMTFLLMGIFSIGVVVYVRNEVNRLTV